MHTHLFSTIDIQEERLTYTHWKRDTIVCKLWREEGREVEERPNLLGDDDLDPSVWMRH